MSDCRSSTLARRSSTAGRAWGTARLSFRTSQWALPHALAPMPRAGPAAMRKTAFAGGGGLLCHVRASARIDGTSRADASCVLKGLPRRWARSSNPNCAPTWTGGKGEAATSGHGGRGVGAREVYLNLKVWPCSGCRSRRWGCPPPRQSSLVMSCGRVHHACNCLPPPPLPSPSDCLIC